MKCTAFLAAVTLTVVATLQAAPVQAQPAAKTFVSSTGSDASPCSRLQPCRLLSAAIAKTVARGEITILDPGNYGQLTITKGISIVNEGVGAAGVLVQAGTGITINAGPGDEIHLRGLIIEGRGLGPTGLRFNTGGSLSIQNCAFHNFTGNAIEFFPAGNSHLFVSQTLASDNAVDGFRIEPTGAGNVTAVLNRVEAHNNSGGVIVRGGGAGTVKVTVNDSVAARTQGTGFLSASAGAATSLMLVRSVAANNAFGVAQIGANAIARLAQSTVTGNDFGLSGPVLSYGDNYINGNGSSETPGGLVARK